jgi:hypothetical protein
MPVRVLLSKLAWLIWSGCGMSQLSTASRVCEAQEMAQRNLRPGTTTIHLSEFSLGLLVKILLLCSFDGCV